MTNEILKDEIMSEMELDNVAGGNRNELALDTQLFNAMGGRSKAYDLEDITNTNVRGIVAKVDTLWNNFGIQVSYNDAGENKYYIDGDQISRNKAIKEVLFRAGYKNISAREFFA